MGLEDAARKGQLKREEQRQAAQASAEAAEAERRERHARRLDRAFGIDPDAGGYAIYLGVMSVIFAAIPFFVSGDAPGSRSSALAVGLSFAGVTAVVAALVAWSARRSKEVRAEAQRWLRSRPFAFDGEAYERALVAYDHSDGWMRVAIHFRPGKAGALQQKLADAAIGLGGAETRWASADCLYVKSPTLETNVDTDSASYTTSRNLHAWFVKFAEALPELGSSVPIERVEARFGFFQDGSFTVDDETEDDVEDEAEAG